MRRNSKGLFIVCAVVLAVIILLAGLSVGKLPIEQPITTERPIVFVHGYGGSADQFETQAMRFTSNSYPDNFTDAYEYNTEQAIDDRTNIALGLLTEDACGTCKERYAALDEVIDTLLAKTGADQVDLVGHSLGTCEIQAYLESSLERPAKIEHYVNIDGLTGDHLPGGVPTLALWAGTGVAGREITGALNVTIPGVSHVQAATCSETFLEMYKFFNGRDPLTTKVLPEPSEKIQLAGRVINFATNDVPQGNTSVEIYEVEGATGQRISLDPMAVFSIGDDGKWGPFIASPRTSYEFYLILDDGVSLPQHYYYEPYIRSDYLIRLKTSPPDEIAAAIEKSDFHSNLVVIRNKEFWGDQEGNNDSLLINGNELCTSVICPIVKKVIAMFLFDVGSDGVSNLSSVVPTYAAIPFLTGTDLYLPADALVYPPEDTIPLVLYARGGKGGKQMINVPNWASTESSILVQFNDYVQVECIDNDGDGYGKYCTAGLDCADNNSAVHPGATEVCNGIDDDCDNATDEEGCTISTTTTTMGATTSVPTTTTIPSTTTTVSGRRCLAKKALGENNPNLENLRDFRDNKLAKSAVGRKIIQIYYNNSESINTILERSPALRAFTKRVLEAVAPMVGRKEE